MGDKIIGTPLGPIILGGVPTFLSPTRVLGDPRSLPARQQKADLRSASRLQSDQRVHEPAGTTVTSLISRATSTHIPLFGRASYRTIVLSH